MNVTSANSGASRPVRTVQSLDRAMALLGELSGHAEGIGLVQLAEACRLKPQTALSLLRTLERWEMVVQPRRGGVYVMGPRPLALAQHWMALDGHAALARPHVETLSRETGEYILLAERRGAHLYRLIEQQADQRLAVRPPPPGSMDMHVMATGKLLLAFAEQAERDALLAILELPQQGPRTITDRRAFALHLDKVRTSGFAESVDERDAHTAALAVPVRNAAGQVHAALGTFLPNVRYSRGRRAALLRALRTTAARIEAAWGGSRVSPGNRETTPARAARVP